MATVHRVALVASHVIQYQAPFFRLLAAESDLDLTVLYGSRAGAARKKIAAPARRCPWPVTVTGPFGALDASASCGLRDAAT
jgi:hypothetical protein